MSAHKWHKEIMAVAEAAKTSDEPWDILHVLYVGETRIAPQCNWTYCLPANLIDLILCNPNYEFRIKPRTIMINGIEVPEPLRVKPEMGQKVYLAQANSRGGTEYVYWEDNNPVLVVLFNSGRLHLTEEAARTHYEADCAGSRMR